jgi:hypothetical protein
MVYLALEPAAAHVAIELARQNQCSVWVGSDGITSEEFEQLVQQGVRITRFAYPLSHASPETVADALDTVKEHHPNEIIWLQHSTSGDDSPQGGSLIRLSRSGTLEVVRARIFAHGP